MYLIKDGANDVEGRNQVGSSVTKEKPNSIAGLRLESLVSLDHKRHFRGLNFRNGKKHGVNSTLSEPTLPLKTTNEGFSSMPFCSSKSRTPDLGSAGVSVVYNSCWTT